MHMPMHTHVDIYTNIHSKIYILTNAPPYRQTQYLSVNRYDFLSIFTCAHDDINLINFLMNVNVNMKVNEYAGSFQVTYVLMCLPAPRRPHPLWPFVLLTSALWTQGGAQGGGGFL